MNKIFKINDRQFEIRDRDDGETLIFGVFEGNRKLLTLEVTHETLADADGALGDLAAFVEADFRRLVDEGLLII